MQNMENTSTIAAPEIPRVERLRLHDTVVEHLRRLIIEGVLSPGVKLNERELCETLGISRTPLREAFKVLAAEGLIEIAPNRGASVARMTEKEIREMFELMSALEAFSGELAAERMTPVELAEIKALHYAMLACRAQQDLPATTRAIRPFTTASTKPRATGRYARLMCPSTVVSWRCAFGRTSMPTNGIAPLPSMSR